MNPFNCVMIFLLCNNALVVCVSVSVLVVDVERGKRIGQENQMRDRPSPLSEDLSLTSHSCLCL